jgi:hypothetical protein
MKRCLIISPHFPPSTLAGVHRARHLAKHLPSHGWKPVIIRADERHYTEAQDPALAGLVPDDVQQVRTGALPARLARFAGVGDIGLRAYAQIANAIDASIACHKPRIVLITGSPYYPMLLAKRVAKRWGLPVVLDFQDPWVSAEGERQPKWSKSGLAHRLATMLEPRAVRHAAWITSVSETQNDEMAERYPWMSRSRMMAIPIGGDPEDFDAMRATPPDSMAVALDPEMVNLCYIGTFLPRAAPVVSTLFHALALVRSRQPALAARLRLVFVGTSNQPNPRPDLTGSHRVEPLALSAGVADMVREHPARVPFVDALSLMAKADGILLLGSDERHYTASKIYPSLMAGRPFLSIFHRESSSHDILSRAGGGRTYAFAGNDELTALTVEIADSLQQFAERAIQLPPPRAAAYEPYTAHAVSGQFARIFDLAAR